MGAHGQDDTESIGTVVLGRLARPGRPARGRRPGATRRLVSRPTARWAGSPGPSSATATASTSAATASSRSSKPIERLWEQTLGDEFLTRPHSRGSTTTAASSRTRCRCADVLKGLGLVESARCILVLRRRPARLLRGRAGRTFEEWVDRHASARLYDTFFRTYTEKVWGMPGAQIRAEWAAQRIRNFSLGKAISRRPRPCGADPRDDAHRGVPLPAARARADVGGVRRARRASAASRCG